MCDIALAVHDRLSDMHTYIPAHGQEMNVNTASLCPAGV